MQLRKYFYLTVAILLTSIVSLSAHALIIQYFHPPVINIDTSLNQIIGFIIRFLTVMGAFLIYFLSSDYWDGTRPSYRVILFALLIMALTEQLFRLLIMNIVAGTPWAYQVLSTMPSYVSWLTLSLLVCFFVSIIHRNSKLIALKCVVFSALITAVIFFVKKLANDFLTPMVSLVPHADISNSIHLPYGMNVLIPAYITFLEPTIASFILFYLIRNKLSAFNTLIKGLIMGGILIIIHGGIYSMVQIACSEGNIFYRIFYYGQFLWEYLTLGILTAYSVTFLEKNAENRMIGVGVVVTTQK